MSDRVMPGVFMGLVSVLCISLLPFYGFAQGTGDKGPAGFYKNKTVIWIASGAPGSTVDLFSRGMAMLLAKEMGATVVVENKAGGGGWEGVNYVYGKSKPDGLTLGCKIIGPTVLGELAGVPGRLYKSEKFQWIGALDVGPYIFVASPKKYQSIADMQKAKGLKFACTSIPGTDSLQMAAIFSTLNIDAKIIAGPTVTESALSIQKGELDGGNLAESVTLAQGAGVRPLYAVGGKSFAFPDLPVFEKTHKLSDEVQKLIDQVPGVQVCVFMPPEVPQDKVDYVRGLFLKVSKDKAAQQEIVKNLGTTAWYGFIPGEDLQKTVEKLKADKELPTKLLNFIGKYRG